MLYYSAEGKTVTLRTSCRRTDIPMRSGRKYSWARRNVNLNVPEFFFLIDRRVGLYLCTRMRHAYEEVYVLCFFGGRP